jgi:phage tail sheath protein FI
MAYKHQVTVTESATGVITPVVVDSALPIVVGTAPVNMTDPTNVNKPVLAYTYAEAVAAMGFVDANPVTGLFEYTISEFIDSHFSKFGASPVVLVNVADPSVNKKSVASETVVIADGKGTLANTGAIKSSVVITGKVLGTDYELAFTADGKLNILAIDGGSLADGNTTVAYDAIDATTINDADIVGGIDVNGKASGLELVDSIFPMFRKTLGLILAPKYSGSAAVAAVMKAKAKSVSGMFKAQAVIDVPTDTVTKYQDVAKWKNDNNVTDPYQIVCWPMVALGGKKYHLSTQLAGVIALTDSANGDNPHKSPSNESLQADSAVLSDGTPVWLTPVQAADQLNGQGVVTALNFIGGWKVWGNNTAAYPAITDVKDRWIPVRRMFSWVGNTIIQTMWQRLDQPINRRQVEIVTDSVNQWLNALVARGYLLGARVEFRESDNPDIQLLDGKTVFRVFLTPPTPNEEIEFILEYDPSYFATLFE